MNDLSTVLKKCALGEDGIWYSEGVGPLSYPEDGNELLFAIEDQSFWFRHRNRCILAALERHPPVRRDEPILDVGGGNGAVARALLDAGYAAAVIEPGAQGAANAKARGVQDVACSTLEAAGIRPSSVGAMGFFDVIEHLEDSTAHLAYAYSLLRPGGKVYLTVPAYPFLWSQEDVDAGHFRRYTRLSICRLLTDVGFSIDYSTHFFRFLPIPIFFARSLPFKIFRGAWPSPSRRNPASQHVPPGQFTATVLQRLLHAESIRIASGEVMSFGASVLVVAVKPGDKEQNP